MNQTDPTSPELYVIKRCGVYIEELLGVYTTAKLAELALDRLVSFEPDSYHTLVIQPYILNTTYRAESGDDLEHYAVCELQSKVIYSRKRPRKSNYYESI